MTADVKPSGYGEQYFFDANTHFLITVLEQHPDITNWEQLLDAMRHTLPYYSSPSRHAQLEPARLSTIVLDKIRPRSSYQPFRSAIPATEIMLRSRIFSALGDGFSLDFDNVH